MQMFINLSDLKSRDETKLVEILINGQVMGAEELTEMVSLFFSGSIDDQQFFTIPSRSLLWNFAVVNPILDCLLPGVKDLRLWFDESVALTKQLIERFRNLESLQIGSWVEPDEDFFECIFKNCRKIWHLTIGCSHLKQNQLDRTPNYFQNLYFLTFEGALLEGNSNLDFIAKFKNLFTVQFDFNLKEKALSFLLKNCNRVSIWNCVASKVFGSSGSHPRSSAAANRCIAMSVVQTRASRSIASRMRSSITTSTTCSTRIGSI